MAGGQTGDRGSQDPGSQGERGGPTTSQRAIAASSPQRRESGQLITDEVLDAAFEWLLNSSQEIASARGNLIRAEYKTKRIFSRLFSNASGTVDQRKAYATDHPEYADAQEALAVAEEAWERAKDQRNRAELIVEAWRTEQASRRIVDKIR